VKPMVSFPKASGPGALSNNVVVPSNYLNSSTFEDQQNNTPNDQRAGTHGRAASGNHLWIERRGGFSSRAPALMTAACKKRPFRSRSEF
jgi:hypothetical protein